MFNDSVAPSTRREAGPSPIGRIVASPRRDGRAGVVDALLIFGREIGRVKLLGFDPIERGECPNDDRVKIGGTIGVRRQFVSGRRRNRCRGGIVGLRRRFVRGQGYPVSQSE